MYQPSTNFFGKDNFRWWIGQVTDPDKGEWKECLEKTQAENEEDIYSFRCRVRIVGYHDCADDLPDKDLPLAHILLPPNTATTGGCGETVQYQGGEVVVGFFADGDDAQQPIIFGTLFRQTFVEDELTTTMFNAKRQTCFTPYTPPKVVQTAGKQNQHQASPWPRSFTPGEVSKTIAQKQKEAATNIVVDNFSPCEDNEISKISNAIKNFTRKVESLQSIGGGANIDPIYGGIVDINSEIRQTTNLVHNSMTKLIRRGRSWLIQDTLDKLDKTMEGSVDKFNQVVLGQATNALTSVIFCNIEKIQDQLLDYLSKSLENMIGQVLDVPICGVENFLGNMFGQINNILDSNLGSMFGQLNSITGGGLPLPSKTFSKAIKFANIITNVLDCDKVNCPPSTSYSSKNGVNKAIGDSFDVFGNILDKAGLNAITDFAENIDSIADGIPAKPSAPNCNTNVLKCGPPRVDFIGSSGQGATGSAIVNVLGKIIGVAINGTGYGYTEPPLLSFFDSCDKGYGAGGYPIMGNVSFVKDENGNNLLDDDGNIVTVIDPNGTEFGVIDVVMTDSGQEYLPNTTETDLDGNVKDVIPDPNGNYDGETSYVTSLSDVIVDNVGFGYDDNDTASVGNGSIVVPGDTTGDIIQKPGDAQIDLNIQNGLIVGANVTNGGFGFTGLPDITINSDTGAGAKLLPVLKFTKVDDASQLAELPQVSQDVVVTVISCIEK